MNAISDEADYCWRMACEQLRSPVPPYLADRCLARARLLEYRPEDNQFRVQAGHAADAGWLAARRTALERALGRLTGRPAAVVVSAPLDPGTAGRPGRGRPAEDWGACGIPDAFCDLEPEDLDERTALMSLPAVRDSLSGRVSRTLILSGPPGTGKTAVAVCLLKQAAADGERVLFADSRGLIRRLQSDFQSAGSSGRRQFQRACAAGLLVLDDFNLHGLSDWAALQLGDLVRIRDGQLGARLIITTNHDRRELVYSPLQKQTVSRLLAGAVLAALPADAPDLRMSRRPLIGDLSDAGE